MNGSGTAGATRGLLFRLAWRNLWRNPRRTIIAGASIFFAVFLSVLISSTQIGQNQLLIDTVVGFSTGHVQVQGKEYWEKRSLDQSMPLDTVLEKHIAAVDGVAHVVPRLETVALVARGTITKVVPVFGVDPLSEDGMTGFGKRLVRGTKLAAWKEGALIGAGLARMLGADAGDTLVLYGQGYQGVTAAGLIRIAGILEYPIPDMNNAAFFLPLGLAQEIFASDGRVTSIAVMLTDQDDCDAIAAQMRGMTVSGTEVMTWRQLMPELVQAIDANNGGTVLMLLILYIVIGFGIFSTVVMMTTERRQEFRMLISLGMRRGRLAIVTVIEAVCIAMAGAMAGIAGCFPLVLWLHFHPIVLGGEYAKVMLVYGMEPVLPFSVDPVVFWAQGAIVAGLGIVSSVYPVFVIRQIAKGQAKN
jgi:ABC-type lipoprotein release transport system permease subunit